ncbi:hypothetical protein [Leptolyngbya sp. 7M]|uniref:hypothetical protein n=1 Tax=Leptolyngbya sp. 7M TaxID=2812896 RepID=UPI0021F13697|nr:hypothetical protein [Leptolyngbya sp. 7M]
MPEVADLPPELLGTPPRVSNYPAPILNYRQARQRRVKQLEQQRQSFRQQQNILPYIARLPDSLVPFGSERFSSEIGWALSPHLDLFPTAIDLDQLDLQAAKMLRTWFVAHVEIKPQPTPRRQSKRKRKKQADGFVQLSLLT